MAPDREKTSHLARMVKRHMDRDKSLRIRVLQTARVIIEPESRGYDPYDNPGPAPVPRRD